MIKIKGEIFPILAKKLSVDVKFIASTEPTDERNQNDLSYTPFFLFDYLQRNAVEDIIITSYNAPTSLTMQRELVDPKIHIDDLKTDEISIHRIEIEKCATGQYRIWPLGIWYYTDNDFLIFCDALKKATNLKNITFRFLDVSSELTTQLISVLKTLPSIKVGAFDCGEILTNALNELKNEKPLFIGSYTPVMKFESPSSNLSKPFNIRTINMRIINGFLGAYGLLAIIAAFFPIPTAIVITSAVLGTVALATRAYGFFTTIKQPPIQTLLNLDNTCSLN